MRPDGMRLSEGCDRRRAAGTLNPNLQLQLSLDAGMVHAADLAENYVIEYCRETMQTYLQKTRIPFHYGESEFDGFTLTNGRATVIEVKSHQSRFTQSRADMAKKQVARMLVAAKNGGMIASYDADIHIVGIDRRNYDLTFYSYADADLADEIACAESFFTKFNVLASQVSDDTPIKSTYDARLDVFECTCGGCVRRTVETVLSPALEECLQEFLNHRVEEKRHKDAAAEARAEFEEFFDISTIPPDSRLDVGIAILSKNKSGSLTIRTK